MDNGWERRYADETERRHAMPDHKIATSEEWQAARDELLKEEKELTRRNDELAKKRRELPWVPVEKEYTFATDEGTSHSPSSSTVARNC